MTKQMSKFSKHPRWNSSVMVIDCAAARSFQYFHFDQAVDFLKLHPDKESYGNLMFPNWLVAGHVGVEWNSLNIYAKLKTKLLHYTKEPEQPWYKPDHPLSNLWRQELALTLEAGEVTPQEIREAVAEFGKATDWRSTNGLHPSYLKLLT
jgi:hypothetical protein